MHHRLIKEIHNKSLERSRKDSSIQFDERGNLINRHSTSENILCTSHKLSTVKGCSKLFSMSNQFAQLEEEEPDGLNELISISQIPSVVPTLERKETSLKESVKLPLFFQYFLLFKFILNV